MDPYLEAAIEEAQAGLAEGGIPSAPTDSLGSEWRTCDLVWMNPPYSEVEKWMAKLVSQFNGIACIFARTETEWWHKYIWGVATRVLFLKGRLHFHHGDGDRAMHNAGGPTALVAYGPEAAMRLDRAVANGNLAGRLVTP